LGSDRSGERVWHNALPLAWMVLAMLATFLAIRSLWAMIPLLTLIAAGTYASKGPFWALSSEWLGATSAAAGLAQINALGNLAGTITPWVVGTIKDSTGSFAGGLFALAGFALLAAVVTIIGLPAERRRAALSPAFGAPAE